MSDNLVHSLGEAMPAHSGDPEWLPADETVPGNNKVKITSIP